MNEALTARASITINASLQKVWDALVNPEVIKRYMFGATVISDWTKGSSIVWKGEWKGKGYEDKGVLLDVEPRRLLRYSHYSPLPGLPDVPENYHRVTIELDGNDEGVRIDLCQDNNRTEEDRKHSEQNWAMMLASLKKVLES